MFFLATSSGYAIPTNFNTGADDSGTLLAAGASEQHFSLVFPTLCCYSGLSTNVFGTNFLTAGDYAGGPALHNTATAEWIGYNGFGPLWANGTDGNEFAFVYQFSLTQADIDAGGLNLTGSLGLTGDLTSLSLNGVTNSLASFFDAGQNLHPFSVTNGFQVGTNSLRIGEEWTYAQGNTYGNNSLGIIVDNASFSSNATPEPATLGIAGLGGLLVLLRVRRRSA
jgi:hypothetical protein